MDVIKPGTMQVCSAMGISLTKGKLLDLEKLEKSIQQDIGQVMKSKNHTELIANTLLGLRLVKATCDSFISLAAEAADLIGAGGAAKMVSSAYTGTSALAEAGSRQAFGQKAEWGAALATAGTSAVAFVAARSKASSDVTSNFVKKRAASGMTNNAAIDKLAAARALTAKNAGTAATMVKQGKIKSELVVAAINQDEAGVRKAATEYSKSVAIMVAGATNPKLGKLGAIIQETDKYNRAVQKAFDEALEDKDTSNLDSLKRQMERQLTQVRQQIMRFRMELAQCMSGLADAEPAKVAQKA